jgi:uncharacterized damage-inducible protein DinB
MTYLQGRDLTPAQLDALQAEQNRDHQGADELLAEMNRVFHEAESIVRSIDPNTLADGRTVGRKKLPTTVIGLLTHIAEHTQRHVGQAITACKLGAHRRP